METENDGTHESTPLRLFTKRLDEVGLDQVPDGRDDRGNRWDLGALLRTVVGTTLAGARCLAEVDEPTPKPPARAIRPAAQPQNWGRVGAQRAPPIKGGMGGELRAARWKIEYNLAVGIRWCILELTSVALVALACGRTTANDDASASGATEGGASISAGPTGADSVETTAASSTGGAGSSVSTSMGGVTTGAAGSEPMDELQCDAPNLASPEEWALRLARLLWDTDGGVLADAVASGELDLSDAEDVQAQVFEMLEDAEQGRVGLPSFVKAWLSLDESRLSMPDELLASTLESTDRTLEAMIFEDDWPLSVFFNGDWAVVDEALAAHYGTEPPEGDWGVVTLPEPRRAGLLGQQFWLNATAHPSYRGMVLSNALRCLSIPPGLPGPVREARRTDVTRREEYLQDVAPAACAGCHYWIAPLGLPFEHFDGWGDYRTEDNGFSVDASGGVPDTDIEVEGARELGAVFANELASETEHCVARRVVAYSLGEPGMLPASVFDEPECFERLNPDLIELDQPSFLEWVVALAGSPVFLSVYSE